MLSRWNHEGKFWGGVNVGQREEIETLGQAKKYKKSELIQIFRLKINRFLKIVNLFS